MFYNFYKSLITGKTARSIPGLVVLLGVIAIELFFYLATHIHDIYKDRYICYLNITLWTILLFNISKNKKTFICCLCCNIMLTLICLVHTAFIWGNGNGFNFENIMHLCDIPSILEFMKFSPHYLWQIPLSTFIFAILSSISSYSLFIMYYPRPKKRIATKVLGYICVAMMLCFMFKIFYPLHDIANIYKVIKTAKKHRDLDRDTYLDHGVKVTEKNDEDICASAGKNLVFIILESTELTYLDDSKFPGLLPNLKKFTKQCQTFNNMVMAPNASITFGAMFSMITGSVLTHEHLTFGMNSHVKNHVGSRMSSFPKILNKAGYYQYFAVGHSGHFAGTENFLKQHRYDETWFGIDRSKRESSWEFAVRDSAVFQKGWEFFQRAAATGKPFNISLLTTDAHGPDGFYDPSEPAYNHPKGQKLNIYNAMFASDHALGKFLKRIQSHPAYGKTCIVIVSDHLAHHYTKTIDILCTEKERRMLFLIHNSTISQHRQNILAKTFDIAPTILDAMGVKHDYIFPLGESLYKETTPKRLCSSAKQDTAISIYTKLKSTPVVHLKNGIKLSYQPYPHIKIGELAVAISTGFISDKLQKGDIFILPVHWSKTVRNPELKYCSTLEEFKRARKEHHSYIFIAAITPDIAKLLNYSGNKKFILGIQLKKEKIYKYSNSPELLNISPNEIKSIL